MRPSPAPGVDAPLVSVIIPTFNRWPLVCESIDSALAQDYPNLEVIVVDDGSSDATEEELPRRYGDRVRYIRQENQGPSVARNTGIRQAEGSYIAFLDSDDLWHPRKTAVQVQALLAAPEFGFVYTTCCVAMGDGRRTDEVFGQTDRGRTGDNLEAIVRHNPIMTSSMMVADRVLAEIGPFDPQILSGQDTDLWLRICLSYRGIYIRTPLVWIREHAQRWTHHARPSGKRARGHVRMYSKLLASLPPGREHLRPVIEGRHAESRLLLAAVEFGEEDWSVLFEAVHGILREKPAVLNSFYVHEALARVVWSRGDARERAAADIAAALADRSLTGAGGRRWQAMFYSALARRSFANGSGRAGTRWSAWAALTSPGAFARYLLPTLPRRVGWAVRRFTPANAMTARGREEPAADGGGSAP